MSTLIQPTVRRTQDAASGVAPVSATRSVASLRVVFVIRQLGYGGAERQLVLLARGLRQRGHDVSVAVFYSGGAFEQELEAAGIRVIRLHKRGRWHTAGFLLQLARSLRQAQPDVVHGYIGLANVCALIFRPIHRGRVVWGVRSTGQPLEHYDWTRRLEHWLESTTAPFADLVIANSYAGAEEARGIGFPAGTMTVVPNGVNLERFQRDPAGRDEIRAELGVADHEILVGRVGRIDPQKDYPGFLYAVALLARSRTDIRVLCVGDGPEPDLRRLQAQAVALGLGDRITWWPGRGDLPRIYSALDLAVSSSAFGEGTPNVVAEAMACGVPNVVTDSGDCARTVGDLGVVVPPSDTAALADGMARVIGQLKRSEIDPAALRDRIASTLSTDLLIDRTERHLLALCEQSR